MEQFTDDHNYDLQNMRLERQWETLGLQHFPTFLFVLAALTLPSNHQPVPMHLRHRPALIPDIKFQYTHQIRVFQSALTDLAVFNEDQSFALELTRLGAIHPGNKLRTVE